MSRKTNVLMSGLILAFSLALAACGEENTPVPAPTTQAVPAFTTAPAVTSGPGSELNGQMFAVGDADVRVQRVERYTEVKTKLNTFPASKGVFMVVALDVANLGKKPLSLGDINVADSANTEYSPLSIASSEGPAFQSSFGYFQEIYLNPGLVETFYRIYDLPKDASGLKLVFKSSAAKSTTRQPSAESFTRKNASDSGAGQELAGKTVSAKLTGGTTADIKVTKVDRLNEVSAPFGNIKPNGAFLILSLEVKNNSTKEVCCQTPVLKDSEGRLYASGSIPVITAVSSRYKSSLSVKGGETGPDFAVYEVPKDAKGFELLEPASF